MCSIEEMMCLESTYLKILLLRKRKQRFNVSHTSHKKNKISEDFPSSKDLKLEQPDPDDCSDLNIQSSSLSIKIEETFDETHANKELRTVPGIQRRRFSSHPLNLERGIYGEFYQLYNGLREDPGKFFDYMKMSVETFDYICDLTRELLSKDWKNCHARPIMPEERLMLTIRFLSTGLSFRNLAHSFRMGTSTVSKTIKEVVKVLWQAFQPIHMKMPSAEEFLKIAGDFSTLWNFPHCVGVIDCLDIQVNNQDHSDSIVLQAISDANYRFINVEVGGYGTCVFNGSFKTSWLHNMLCSLTIDIPKPDTLPDTTIWMPYVFIGNETFPLLPNLMKPYSRLQMDQDKLHFNSQLLRARETIDHAFGIMYSKWGLLAKAIETEVTTADDIVKAICILHNIVIDKEGIHLEAGSKNMPVFPRQFQYPIAPHGRPTAQSQYIRDSFKTFFYQKDNLNTQ